MTRLVRWRPFYDSLRLMNEMEQMFNDLTSWPEHRLWNCWFCNGRLTSF